MRKAVISGVLVWLIVFVGLLAGFAALKVLDLDSLRSDPFRNAPLMSAHWLAIAAGVQMWAIMKLHGK